MSEAPTSPPAVSGEGASAAPPPAWLLRLAYDGSAYNGWQKQPGLETVQGTLEERLRRLYRAGRIHTLACSRTDTGVHALDQQVHVTLPVTPVVPPERAIIALNRSLPSDIRVLTLTPVSHLLDVRVLARAKAYTYIIHQGEMRSPFHANAGRSPGAGA